jgi:hypothetical protein
MEAGPQGGEDTGSGIPYDAENGVSRNTQGANSKKEQSPNPSAPSCKDFRSRKNHHIPDCVIQFLGLQSKRIINKRGQRMQ